MRQHGLPQPVGWCGVASYRAGVWPYCPGCAHPAAERPLGDLASLLTATRSPPPQSTPSPRHWHVSPLLQARSAHLLTFSDAPDVALTGKSAEEDALKEYLASLHVLETILEVSRNSM